MKTMFFNSLANEEEEHKAMIEREIADQEQQRKAMLIDAKV